MGTGSDLRIKAIRWSGIGSAMFALSVVSACEREPDLDPPAKIQVACTPSAPTSSAPPATASAALPIVLVLDTGDQSARWVNGPGAPVGALTVQDQQYLLRFGQEPTGWRATLNRFDGMMVREVGKAGAARAPQRFACKRETEGPKF